MPKGIAAGSGGGYFIAKNSWGTDFGDMGYCYMPYDWVKKWTHTLIVVSNVSQ